MSSIVKNEWQPLSASSASNFLRIRPSSCWTNRRHTHFESFCNQQEVTVSFNDIPVSSARVVVRRRVACGTEITAPPLRLHFGFATASSKWNNPRDASFKSLSEDASVVDLNFSRDATVVGISFVIQCEGDFWLRDFEGKDFYVGWEHRLSPSCVELPFEWPIDDVEICQMTSLHKSNPFWFIPELHHENKRANIDHSLASPAGLGGFPCLHDETVFFLSKVKSTRNSPSQDALVNQKKYGGLAFSQTTGEMYVVIIMTSDLRRGVNATLFDAGGEPAIRLETGLNRPLSLKDVEGMAACFTAWGTDPYETVRVALESASNHLNTFCTREQKIGSHRWRDVEERGMGLLEKLGYCTWDSFGHDVGEAEVVNALKWLSGAGVQIGYVIIDDGWQSGGADGPSFEHDEHSKEFTDRPTLTSYEANEKFSGSLRGIQYVMGLNTIAWTAAIGYWGGVSGLHCGIETEFVRGMLPKGLHRAGIERGDIWEKRYELVKPSVEVVRRFYEDYFRIMREQGVRGVKVDGQGILEGVGNVPWQQSDQDRDGFASVAAVYRQALSEAVEAVFPKGIVINSMACGQQNILGSGNEVNPANICWRTSNDHAFPGVEEDEGAVAWHIICNAVNAFFLGGIFPVPDWDMFRACDSRFANVHAAARVLSGGPVYISDTTPFADQNALSLLRSLSTRDGTILRCADPGRPTVDSLFGDPRQKNSKLFKIYNRSAVLGIIGLFNLSNGEDGGNLSGEFAPGDVADFGRMPGDAEYISLILGPERFAFRHKNHSDARSVTVREMSAVLAHICPIFGLACGVKFAVVGMPHLLNAGAAVESVSITILDADDDGNVQQEVDVKLRDAGKALFWLDEWSIGHIKSITAPPETSSTSWAMREVGNLRFAEVAIPVSKPHRAHFVFQVKHSTK